MFKDKVKAREKIALTREEALVSLIGLEKYKKPNIWQAKAITSIIRQMGLSRNPLAAQIAEIEE